MSAGKDEKISDLVCQAQSIEAILIVIVEKLEALLCFNDNKFNQETSRVSCVLQDSAYLMCQAQDLEAKLLKSIDRLSTIVALYDGKYSESAGQGKPRGF